MSELIMPKNEGRLDFFDESIKYVSENGGIMKTDEFVEKVRQSHPGMDTTSCYHKIVMARYFGLVLFNSHSSYYFLTEAGSVYSSANNKYKKIDAILKALTSVSFGRNNNAVSSDSDIEAPVVMLKAIVSMGSASMTQIGLILYHMDINSMTLSEAIKEVEKCTDISGMRRYLTENKKSKYFDVKFNKLFEELGIVEKEQGNYILSKYVKENHITFINNLPELKPVSSIDDANSSSSSEDIFNHSLYGIHIKEQNDALSDERPHICIGWSAMGDLSNITTKEDLSARYEVTWPNEKARKKGQDIGQIWRFINEMQIGDYVIFADGDICHIGRITSDYYFDNSENPNQDSDYANIRDVEWLQKDIRKSDLSEVFQNSLGAAMFVFRLNDYKSALNDLLNDTYVKDELLLEEIEEEDIFSGFEPWLTSPNNPDYTGKQKYGGYARAIVKLVDFMYGKNLIEDTDLNDKNIEKYTYWVEIYEGSDEARDFDVNKNSNKAGSAALKKYIKYIKYLTTPHIVDFDYSITKNTSTNMIFYGVPGCGKSYHIQHNVLGITPYIRTTFYQDYSNTDFVGQILPKVVKSEDGKKDTVEYTFNPGPFTLALIQAISNPTEKVALVIEEINRGNAPAIFGDIFQLLDRGEDGISEYGIKNVGVIDYLNAYEFTVDGEKKRYHFDEIKIPGNLAIYATMNTSDQNVYTLDTAFTRRWAKERIENEFGTNEIKDMYVPGMTSCTWGTFVDKVNMHIRSKIDELQVNEDKQVGCFFVKKSDLLVRDEADEDKKKAKLFAYKVLEYLWDDVSKLDHTVIFNPNYKTFEDLVKDYLEKGVEVFNGEIFK